MDSHTLGVATALMVVDDFDIGRSFFGPSEANLPLIINPDGVLSATARLADNGDVFAAADPVARAPPGGRGRALNRPCRLRQTAPRSCAASRADFLVEMSDSVPMMLLVSVNNLEFTCMIFIVDIGAAASSKTGRKTGKLLRLAFRAFYLASITAAPGPRDIVWPEPAAGLKISTAKQS